jgi:hypothetical protein
MMTINNRKKEEVMLVILFAVMIFSLFIYLVFFGFEGSEKKIEGDVYALIYEL